MARRSAFNAQRARAKRPCPLWVDAFQRDTQHLEADEIGAYMLILMAMWTRETCDFPADPNRLSRVSRVSLRLWKSRVGPTLMPFFTVENGMLWSKRLRQEASYTERQVTHQSDRRSDEKSDNYLINHNARQSADKTADVSTAPSYPTTQQPRDTVVTSVTPVSLDGGGGGAREADADPPTFRERILAAMGRPSGLTATGKIAGTPTDMVEAKRWISDLGLTEDEVVQLVAATAAPAIARGDPPSGFRYFTQTMQRHAAAKAEGALRPAQIAPRETPTITADKPRQRPRAQIPEEFRE